MSYLINGILGLLFLICICIPIFLHLDFAPIYYWDESLYALRALYMAETGQYLSDFGLIQDVPSHLNTKPPLMTWVQAQFMRWLGYNELALRLPSALSVLLLISAYLWFSYTQLKDITIGVFSSLVLVTTTGFITIHGSRTGDHDAPLSVFMFLGLLFFYLFSESDSSKKSNYYLALLVLFILLSVLTKNIIGLLFIPGYIYYLWQQKNLIPILRSKKIYIAATFFLLAISTTVILFEHYNSGFIARMWNYELLGRYTSTLENHQHSFFYYVIQIFKNDFSPWILLLPISFFILKIKPHYKHRKVLILLLAASLLFLMIISFSKTKLEWYEMPIYPCFAMIVGLVIKEIYDFMKKWIGAKNNFFSQRIYSVYFFIAVFILPYQNIFNNIYVPHIKDEKAKYGYMVKEIAKKNLKVNNYSIWLDQKYTHAAFYKEVYNKKGFKIDLVNDPAFLNKKHVIICEEEVKKQLKNEYNYKVLLEKKGCWLVEIL